MKLSDFNYHLPPELIATKPAEKRDQSRLLVLDKITGKIEHKYFFDLIDYLEPGDLLVANNSKVIPARLLGKKNTGGEIEVFLSKHTPPFGHPSPSFAKAMVGGQEGNLSRPVGSRRIYSPLERGQGCVNIWECLIKGRVKVGTIIVFSSSTHSIGSGQESSRRTTKLSAEIVEVLGDGVSLVKFNLSGAEFMKELAKIGQVPLPPYIEKQRRELSSPLRRGRVGGGFDDKKDYQTVYADDNQPGSVAAPTAGLHFTPALLKKIKAKGVGVEYLTLHVGLGTFLPVKTEKIEEHKIHSEYAEVGAELIKKIIETKKRGGRIIAVGTTTTRTLEYVFSCVIPAQAGIQSKLGKTLDPGLRRGDSKVGGDFAEAGNLVATGSPLRPGRIAMTDSFSGWVDIFIYPPYKFKIVDALVTNFHLPKSTLLMLVSTLATKKNIDKAYQEAIKKKYRFYSYGDAMLIT